MKRIAPSAVSVLSRCMTVLGLPLFLVVYFAFVNKHPENPDWLQPSPTSARIVSFAPSITEILYELGLGDNVVGVTQFCKYPSEAAQKDKVGGHASPNYEAIVRLKPDLLVMLKEQGNMVDFLDKSGIRYVTVGSDSVEEIINSIQTIAAACSVKERGDSLVQNLRVMINRDTSSPQPNRDSSPTSSTTMGGRADSSLSTSAKRPTVLLCVSRENIGGGAVGKCVAAGASSFYSELIEIAGGVNILKDTPQAYPAIGAEAIVRMNPDIIIDISSAYSEHPKPEDCGDWKAFKSVSAIKSGRVHCLHGDYLTVPGPRFVLILDDLRRVF